MIMRFKKGVQANQSFSAYQAQPPGQRRDVLEGLMIATVLVTLWIMMPDGKAFLERLPWLDELHAIRVMESAGFSEVIRSISQNTDSNPPLFHLLGHALMHGLGLSPVPGLRWVSLGFALASMIFAFLITRPVTGRVAAMLGILAMWSHPMASRYAMEIRFYAPWLAFASATIWIGLCRYRQGTAGNAAGLAFFSALLCSIHYFGIISWGLIACGFLVVPWRSLRHAVHALLPLAAGPLALAVCFPVLLQQKKAYSVKTWAELPDFHNSVSYLVNQVGAPQIALAAVLAGLSAFFCVGQSQWLRVQATDSQQERMLAPMVALLAMPLVIVVFSYLVQPALIDRYSVVSLLGMGGLVAWLATRIAPLWRMALASGLLLLGVYSYQVTYQEVMAEVREHEARVRIIRQLPSDLPLVFARRHHQWPSLFALPETSSRSFYLRLANEYMPIRSNMEIFEQETAMIFYQHHGAPLVVDLEEAYFWNDLVFIDWDHGGTHIKELFPGYIRNALGVRMFRLRRNP